MGSYFFYIFIYWVSFTLSLMSGLCFGNQSVEISREIVISDSGPGGFLRSSPSLAHDGKSFLVAWQEGWHGEGGKARICISRINSQGNLIDPGKIIISPGEKGIQENAQIAYKKKIFLVVWQNMRNSHHFNILGARISSSGEILDKQPLQIGPGTRTQVMPDVIADEKGFLVVWHGFSRTDNFAKIFGRAIKTDGTMGQPQIIIKGSRPRIAWNGKNYLLLYSNAYMMNGILAGQATCALSTDKLLRKNGFNNRWSKKKCMWGNSEYALCSMKNGNGWLTVYPGGPPNYWGRSVGIQRVAKITPDGELQTPSNDTNYNPVNGIPENWLDTSWTSRKERKKIRQSKKRNKKAAWPWGKASLIWTDQYGVVVWQRYVMGGMTGFSLTNGDLRIGRVNGWKAIDPIGGFALADSKADEVNPAIDINDDGTILCVYEKRLFDGKRLICGKIITFH